ncbi:MAG: S1 RNA-binding domain-containing protein [Candidatus ainarchaeum sp.]|nr:S1 RNA-binding domain-containing protein [Candidatus ainarchaeum sp.]
MIEYPKIAEIVVCKIIKITDFGVFVSLLEYDDIEGFVHVSQISSTWVKNIHNHVKINQIRAAKVLHIDTKKNQIDVSFNRVSEADEKRKISDYRLFKRAQGLMSAIATDLGLDQDTAWTEIAEPLMEKNPNLYDGFVNIVKYGVNYCPDIDKKHSSKLFDVLSKSITVKDKKIISQLEISCSQENGAEIIKKNLTKIVSDFKGTNIIYLAPGKYELTIVAKDYKLAHKVFLEMSAVLEKSFKGCNLNIITSDKLKKETKKK